MQNKNQIDIGQLLMQQATQQPTPTRSTSLTYFELLSLILVILKGLGYLSCSWIVPFIPICLPIVAYVVVTIISFIKVKFFTK
jgi:hypothetical protein